MEKSRIFIFVLSTFLVFQETKADLMDEIMQAEQRQALSDKKIILSLQNGKKDFCPGVKEKQMIVCVKSLLNNLKIHSANDLVQANDQIAIAANYDLDHKLYDLDSARIVIADLLLILRSAMLKANFEYRKIHAKTAVDRVHKKSLLTLEKERLNNLMIQMKKDWTAKQDQLRAIASRQGNGDLEKWKRERANIILAEMAKAPLKIAEFLPDETDLSLRDIETSDEENIRVDNDTEKILKCLGKDISAHKIMLRSMMSSCHKGDPKKILSTVQPKNRPETFILVPLRCFEPKLEKLLTDLKNEVMRKPSTAQCYNF